MINKIKRAPYLNTHQVEKGKQYYFIDTDFCYNGVKVPSIKKETVYRIIGGEYSTKEPNDRYETIRVMVYKTKEDAEQDSRRFLEEYRDYCNREIDKALQALTPTISSDKEKEIDNYKQMQKDRFAIKIRQCTPVFSPLICEVCKKKIVFKEEYVKDTKKHYTTFHLQCLPENYKIIEVKKRFNLK